MKYTMFNKNNNNDNINNIYIRKNIKTLIIVKNKLQYIYILEKSWYANHSQDLACKTPGVTAVQCAWQT